MQSGIALHQNHSKVLGILEDSNRKIVLATNAKQLAGYLTVLVKKGGCVVLAQEILELARETGIIVSHQTEDLIEDICSRINESSRKTSREAIVFGAPARRACSTPLKWLIDFNDMVEDSLSTGHETEYGIFPKITTVTKEQPLAVFEAPAPATPGVDILGNKIEPDPEESGPVGPGRGVNFNASDKTFYALEDGRVRIRNNTLSVEPIIDIYGSLSMPNEEIRTSGTVRITDSILDNFSVKCTGEIILEGNLGAATLTTMQSLRIRGGFSGKIRGSVLIGEDVGARYVKDAIIQAGGNIFVHGDIESSEVKVLGKIVAQGSITGGITVAREGIEALNLGSTMGDKTYIVTGHNFLMDSHAELMKTISTKFRQDLHKLKTELDLITRKTKNLDDLDPNEKLRARIMVQKLEACGINLHDVDKETGPFIERKRHFVHCGILVHGMLYGGAEITVGNYTRKFNENIMGPLKLVEDTQTETVQLIKLIPEQQ